MAHIENIANLEIEDAAIDLMPETVAYEDSVLAVSVNQKTVRIIIPPEENRQETIEKVEFLLDKRVIVDTADREQLDAAVEFYYSARRAKVKDCPPRFQFRCPQRWFNLSPTEDGNVRFCGECQRNVYLCRNVDEWRLHAGQGHCVAIPQPSKPDIVGLIYWDYDGE